MKRNLFNLNDLYVRFMIYAKKKKKEKFDFEKLYYHINFNIRFLRISLIFNTMVNAIYQEIWKSKTKLLRDFSRESRDDRVA